MHSCFAALTLPVAVLMGQLCPRPRSWSGHGFRVISRICTAMFKCKVLSVSDLATFHAVAALTRNVKIASGR